VYLFGGVYEEKMAYSNRAWKMDLELMTVEMYDQKGDLPEAREGAVLFWYSTQWLFLYGGYNLLTCQIFSDFYIFNI
jgi:hypothetical protein